MIVVVYGIRYDFDIGFDADIGIVDFTSLNERERDLKIEELENEEDNFINYYGFDIEVDISEVLK